MARLFPRLRARLFPDPAPHVCPLTGALIGEPARAAASHVCIDSQHQSMTPDAPLLLATAGEERHARVASQEQRDTRHGTNSVLQTVPPPPGESTNTF